MAGRFVVAGGTVVLPEGPTQADVVVDGERIVGQAAVRAFWKKWFAGNPDAKFESEEMIVFGDRCTVRWVYRKTHDGRPWHLRGVDVFDPNTGEVRSRDTDEIALWMIDTNYNGESFFVRHCYFTGGNDPYRRLRTALKAEIDEAAWASLYATESRVFVRPETGKIAVKVINDYGDEVMKVFTV